MTSVKLDLENTLHWLIIKGDIDRAEELLEEDPTIDVDQPFYSDPTSHDLNYERTYPFHGKMPIHLALLQKNIPFVELLARYDASGTEYSRGISSAHELSPPELAAQNGYLLGLECLDRLYPELWSKWLSFRIALRSISPEGNIETLEYCLNAVRPHIEWNAHHTQSLLRKAEAQDVSSEFLEYLVNLDFDLNEEEPPVDDDGFEYDRKAHTKPVAYSDFGLSDEYARSAHVMDLYNSLPLTRVAYLGKLALVDLYLEHGADPMKRNSQGLNAFDAVNDARAKPRTQIHSAVQRRLMSVVQAENPNLVVFTPRKRDFEKP